MMFSVLTKFFLPALKLHALSLKYRRMVNKNVYANARRNAEFIEMIRIRLLHKVAAMQVHG